MIKEEVESIGNPAGIGQGTGFGLRERDRDGIGLGHYRLRTILNHLWSLVCQQFTNGLSRRCKKTLKQ